MTPPKGFPSRWLAKRVLAAARERTASIKASGGTPTVVQAMLESLMNESGWNEDDFIKALIEDVEARRRG